MNFNYIAFVVVFALLFIGANASCNPYIASTWVQQNCNIAGYYNCPLPDYYMLFPIEAETYDWGCASNVTATLNQLCGTYFGWINGGCGQNDWGVGCNFFAYCKESSK